MAGMPAVLLCARNTNRIVREAAKRAVALGLRPAAVVRAVVPLWKVLVGAPTPAI
jgi:hypothetical protein